MKNINKIVYIHGWLFGPFIWSNLKSMFKNIPSHEIITLNGYAVQETPFDDMEKIRMILNSMKKNEIIIAYSYGASLILSSGLYKASLARIFLINPFFTPKKRSISDLISSLEKNYELNIKKFVFDSIAAGNLSKEYYSQLIKILKNEKIPSMETLISNLRILEKLNFNIQYDENLYILQSQKDEINDLVMFDQLDKNKFKTYKMNDLPHYPFFLSDEIYKIISSML